MTDLASPPAAAEMFGLVPVGAIIAWAGNIPPAPSSPPGFDPESSGWLVCDGRSLPVADYPLLAGVLGGIYGSGGWGSEETFNLPDFRGYFLRAVDLAQNVDVDPRMPARGGEENGAGSTQASAMQTHTHGYSALYSQIPGGSGSYQSLAPYTDSQQTSAPSVPASGGVSENETRPVNVAVFYLIKAR